MESLNPILQGRFALWASAAAVLLVTAPAARGADETGRQAAYALFNSHKTTAPSEAYIYAQEYLDDYGVDRTGLALKKWSEAYERVAGGVYGPSSAKFGLVYGGLNYARASVLWATRDAAIDWMISPTPDSFVIHYQRSGQNGQAWWRHGPSASSVTAAQNLIVWRQPSYDWQAIAADGTAANRTSPKTDLIQALQPIDGHKPTRLFGSPAGGWVVIWDDLRRAACSPDLQAACDWANQSVFPQGFTPRVISIGENGAWLGIFADNGYAVRAAPEALVNAIKSANDQHKYIETAAIFPEGGWFVKTKVRP